MENSSFTQSGSFDPQKEKERENIQGEEIVPNEDFSRRSTFVLKVEEDFIFFAT